MNISVIMGVHNGERYLSEAIESILTQSMPDFEFIICNDGSTDNTSEILSNYSKKDSRIKCINLEKNRGLANALNVCIRAASGEVIARMDCDDISFPERFEKQFHVLQKGNADIVGSQVIIINSLGRSIKTSHHPSKNNEIKYQENKIKKANWAKKGEFNIIKREKLTSAIWIVHAI